MALELPAPHGVTRRVRAVLFVDIVDSVCLTRPDEEEFIDRWRAFRNAVLREELPRHRGRMVKHLGDGMLMEFANAPDAVGCALDMQARIRLAEAAVPPDRMIQLRVGINVAEIVADEIDLYGHGVNLAARLCNFGKAGEIIISAAVRDRIADGLGVTIEDMGEQKLKGVEEHERVFRAWPAGAVPRAGPDRRLRSGERPSIAVLPFRNRSGESAHDFLGDLVADDLIAHLSRMIDLLVISRLSTTPFRGWHHEPRNVAEALGVRYVLSGDVYVLGAQIVLTAELDDAWTGHVLWSRVFKGALADIFGLQGEIAREVVPHIRNRELQLARAKNPDNLTAYERMLHAIDHLHRSSRQDMELARTMLLAAIAADPAYAAPYAWLARWHVLQVGQGWSTDPASDAIEANRRADEALDRDSTDSWALSVHGLVAAYLNKDLEAALRRYEEALAANPSAVSAWVWSTSALAWLGRGEDAVERSQRAIELSPFDPHRYYFNSIAGTAHAVAGKYEQAIELCQRALRENRMFMSAHRLLTISLALAGRVEEAQRAREELMKLEPNLTIGRWRSRYPGNASEHAGLFCEALAIAGIPR